MNATENALQVDAENSTAALIIFMTAGAGVVINVYAIMVVFWLQLQKNSFGILCLAHEIPDVIILTSFAMFCAPVTYFQINTQKAEELSRLLGHIDFIAWNITVYSHVHVAVNRFVSIYLPLTYRNTFTRRNTCFLVLIYTTLATLQTTPLFFEGCYLYYIPSMYLWSFSPTACGAALQTGDMSLGISLMTIVMGIDFCTFLKIRKTMKAISMNTTSEDRRQQKQEIRFYMQALVQSTVYIIKKLCFYVFSRFMTTKWTLFFFTFYAWMMCHLLDGLILIIYNYRKLKSHSNVYTSSTPISGALSASHTGTKSNGERITICYKYDTLIYPVFVFAEF
uniref:G_PROTEIN_RECEP_F1_2 domain-containing protein n=1 Tax=Steinernema glaseri TaxID=37863 RepID=A0A1I7ZSC0_9BILA